MKLTKKGCGKLKIWESLIFKIISEVDKISERLMERETKRYRDRIQETILHLIWEKSP